MKKEKISTRVRGHASPLPHLPRKILKVETKICALWGILEANLKKSSTFKFIMNMSFVPSICIHRSVIFIFTEKKVYLSIFFPRDMFFSTIFNFHFRKIPRFRDKFQALFLSSRTARDSHCCNFPGGPLTHLLAIKQGCYCLPPQSRAKALPTQQQHHPKKE